MPRVRKPNQAPSELKDGLRTAGEPQLIEPSGDEKIDQPVEIDLSQDEDAAPTPVPKTSQAKDGPIPIGEQTRAVRQAEEAQQRAYQENEQRRQQAYYKQQQDLVLERQAREQAQYDHTVASMGELQARYETAQRDYATARQNNDIQGELEAQGIMGRLNAQLVQLEQGKEDFERRAHEYNQRQAQAPQQHQYQQQQQYTPAQLIDSMQQLMPSEKEWLHRHPELVMNENSRQELQGTFAAATRHGLKRGSPEYFQFFDQRLGFSSDDDDAGDEEVEPKPQQAPSRRVTTQAPVSRSTTDLGNGRQRENTNKITLTAQQRQAARWSGVSEHDYAVELKKLQDLKSRGYYNEGS